MFPSQGLNLSCSCDLCCGNMASLTHCTGPRLKLWAIIETTFNLLHCSGYSPQWSPMILSICVLSVIMFPLSFLIFFFLGRVSKGLSFFFFFFLKKVFFKNCFSGIYYFISAQILVTFFILLTLDLVFFPRFLWRKVRLFEISV